MKKTNVENTNISFRQAVYNFWAKYFDFRGVASRREYWYCWIFMLLVNVLFSFTGAIISSVVGIILLLPRWSVSVRRFHDVGLPGWLYVVPAIGILTWFVARDVVWLRLAMLGYFSPEFMAFIVFVLLVLVFNFVVFCLPSRTQKKTAKNKK